MRESKVPEARSWLRLLWERPLWSVALAIALLLAGVAALTSSRGQSTPAAPESASSALADGHPTSPATPRARSPRSQDRVRRAAGRQEESPGGARRGQPRSAEERRAAQSERQAAVEAARAERLRNPPRGSGSSARSSGGRAGEAPLYALDAPRSLEGSSEQKEGEAVDEPSDFEKAHNDYRGRAMLNAARFAAGTGRCDRALNLSSRALLETAISPQLLGTGIAPCLPVLLQYPDAHPELADALGAFDASNTQ